MATTTTTADPDSRITRDELLRHLDAAYNLARWLCRNEHDAHDIVQESFLRALRFSDQCRPGNGRAWLLKIVRNTCHTWRARSSATVDMTEVHDVASARDATSPQWILERRQDIDRVRQAIDALPDEFREAIVLREIEGLAYKQIAEVLSVPLGTVMSRLSRARERLKELLADCDAEVGP